MHPSEKNFLCAEIFPEPPSLTEVRPQKGGTVNKPGMSFLTAPPKKAGGNSCRAAFSVNHGTDSGKNGNKHCRKINRGVIDPEADTRLSRSLCPVVDDFLREPVCRIRRQVFDKYFHQTGRRILSQFSFYPPCRFTVRY